MRRAGSVIFLTAYAVALALPATTLVYGQVASQPVQQTFNDWLWNTMDWHSFGAASVPALIGGVVRTATTLRKNKPTFRVFIETLVDAAISLLAGFVMFLCILAWQSWRGPLEHWWTFFLLFGAGWLRGGWLTMFDTGLKKGLGEIVDAVVGVVARQTSNYLSSRKEKANVPAEPPSMEDTADSPGGE